MNFSKSLLAMTSDPGYITALLILRRIKVPVQLILIFLATHLDVIGQPVLQWDERFNGPVGSDRGNSITIDSSGNVYVTSRSIGTNTNYDYLTIKYNPNGDTLWTRRFNGIANKSDEPVVIKVDNQGNVYVTGKTERVNGSFDIATVKYDSIGSLEWLAIYNGSITTGDDLAYNIEVDEFSNVYIVGSSFDHYGSTNYTRGIVIQYNYLGVQQWKAYYGDFVNKVLIYDLDKLLIISNFGIVYNIYELNANNGSVILNYPGGTLFESFGTGNDMIIDDAGNIYVVSSKDDVFHSYVYTTKFTLGNTDDPTFTWWRYAWDAVSEYRGISVKLDKNKNVYTLASVTAGINYCTISKRNSSMQSVWIKAYFLDNSIDLYPVSFSLRRKSINPEVYVSGYTSLGDIIIAKFDNNDESVPNLLWELPYDCGNDGIDVASMMVQDQHDNIYITGYSNCNETSDDVKTIKYCLNVPEIPSNISGPLSVCAGDTVLYSVSIDTTVESYTWILPQGWVGQTEGEIIKVVAGNSGNLSVIANKHGCSSDPKSIALSVLTIPNTPLEILADNDLCSGLNAVFSVPEVSGATSYTWYLPSNLSGSSTSNQILVQTELGSGNIGVTANNLCGVSPEVVLNISVNPTPSTPEQIIGDTMVCDGDELTLSILPEAGVNYEWTIPLGWGVQSNTGSTIVVYPEGTGSVSVFGTIGNCSSDMQLLTIESFGKPSMPASINGKNEICIDNNYPYFINEVSGATSYSWSWPAGWIVNVTSDTSILVTADASGILYATAENMCDTSQSQELFITVHSGVPASPGPIIGGDTVCPGDTVQYTINAVPNTSYFKWIQPSIDWDFIADDSSTTVTLIVGSFPAKLRVKAGNGCGESSISELTITECIPVSTFDPRLEESTYIIPNPTIGQFKISSDGLEIKRVEIIDLTGKIVHHSDVFSANSNSININNCSSGLYLVRIYFDNGIATKRLVKL